ncbi:MAG: chromate transporter [Spirochaetaceae bacterium]|jgi:chromate transporter|nr:chromate transporter [Spirochaetaceae bacterium]
MNFAALFITFFQIGLFAVGGGLATLPFLFRLADKYDWLTPQQVGNILAIAQSSPGAIGINMAALTGFEGGGIAGAFAASLGLATPSIIIILIIAGMLTAFERHTSVKAVFAGLRPAAAGLLAYACLQALKIALYNPNAARLYEHLRWKEALLCAAVYLGLVKFRKLHPAAFIALGAAAGIIFGL